MRVRLRSILTITTLVAPVLVTAGCALSDDEQAAADSLRQLLTTTQQSQYHQDIADCLVEKWVGEVGTEPLVADGLLTPKLKADELTLQAMLAGTAAVSRETAEGYAAAAVACADWDSYTETLPDEYPKATPEQLDEYADCLKDISPATRRTAIVDQLTGKAQSASRRAVEEESAACADGLRP